MKTHQLYLLVAPRSPHLHYVAILSFQLTSNIYTTPAIRFLSRRIVLSFIPYLLIFPAEPTREQERKEVALLLKIIISYKGKGL